MDELWQRHKTFIVQCVVGGVAFLIALLVMTSTYSGIDLTQQGNTNLKGDLQKRSSKVPNPTSIRAQKEKADEAQRQIRGLLAKVASTAQGEDYVRENIRWILGVIGKPETEIERYLNIYRQFPITGLTAVREDARSVLVSAAAQRGRQIDETFGLAGGVEDRDAVGDIRVTPNNVLDRNLDWISGVEIRLSLTGHPDDVNGLIRSFNEVDPRSGRMTVLKEIESIARKSADDDTVKASVVLLGLRGKAE